MDKKTKDTPVSEGTDSNAANTSNKTHVIIAFIIGLLIGTFTSPALMPDRAAIDEGENMEEQEAMEEKEGSEMMEEEQAMSTASIEVRDQLAGDRVLIDTVEFEEAGWAVVHEEINGELGNALGAARYDAGSHERGYVKLLRNTELDNTYHVVLYKDNGDSKFSLEDDEQVLNKGEIVSSAFNTIIVDRKTN